MATHWYIVTSPPADSTPALTDSATERREVIVRRLVRRSRDRGRSLRLTGGDVAIHGINHDRDFQGLRVLVCDDGGAIDRRTGWFTSRILRRLGGPGTGRCWCFLLGKVFLQPFGRETHGGSQIRRGREGRGGRQGGSGKIRRGCRPEWVLVYCPFILYQYLGCARMIRRSRRATEMRARTHRSNLEPLNFKRPSEPTQQACE